MDKWAQVVNYIQLYLSIYTQYKKLAYNWSSRLTWWHNGFTWDKPNRRDFRVKQSINTQIAQSHDWLI